jgi:hypothetical protein
MLEADKYHHVPEEAMRTGTKLFISNEQEPTAAVETLLLALSQVDLRAIHLPWSPWKYHCVF